MQRARSPKRRNGVSAASRSDVAFASSTNTRAMPDASAEVAYALVFEAICVAEANCMYKLLAAVSTQQLTGCPRLQAAHRFRDAIHARRRRV